MSLHSCDQRYSAGHEWRFWCGGSDRVGPAALLSRLPLTAPSTEDMAYPCDTSASLLFRVGMSWKKLGRVILVDSRLTLPARNKSPACTVSDSRFGWRRDLHRRKRESRTPFSALFWPRPLPTDKSSTQYEVPQCSVRTRRDRRGNRYHRGLDRCQWHSGNCRPLL